MLKIEHKVAIARELIDDLYKETFDNERIDKGAYVLLSELCDEVELIQSENTQLRTKMEWIPVSERLPLPDKMVLCYMSNGVIDTGYYYDYAWHTGLFGEFVTHWKRLPEPPKTKKVQK